MNKFKKGDTLVVVMSHDRNNIGIVGEVTDIVDGDYYQLDTMPNYYFKENCVDYARGADLIARERRRQIEQEGYSAQHDSQHYLSEFIYAAIAYAESAKMDANNMEMENRIGENAIRIGKAEIGNRFPWGQSNWKPTTCLRDLVKAGALIAAAIDRFQTEKD